MTSNGNKATKWKLVTIVGVLALAALIVRLETQKSVLAEGAQITFHSPAEAGTALAKAAQSKNQPALSRILGPEAKGIVTGDTESDQAAMDSFAAKYAKMNRWVDMTDGSRVLYIGADNFAFPVPLAKNSNGRWYFDGIAGSEEIRARDIGRNELLTIDACTAIAAAQELYFDDGGASPEYAQRIVTAAGERDELYWAVSEEQGSTPRGNLSEFPKSSLASASPDKPLVIDGYSVRILTAQGADAPGGAKSYIVNGQMSDGFAILATPLKYGETGIMTFMTGRDGVIYERDLGPDTKTTAASIQEFNPTADWSAVE